MTTGDRWLEHPGTVGQPVNTEVKILGEDGKEMPTGEIGEIYLKSTIPGERYQYIGQPTPPTDDEGFGTFGDMGYVDADGFVYIADRRRDMIVTGGANVYPAEVEAVLTEHAGVLDVVVVGLPDPEWGHRVHAIVQPVDPSHPPTTDELRCALQGATRCLQGAQDLRDRRADPAQRGGQGQPLAPGRGADGRMRISCATVATIASSSRS